MCRLTWIRWVRISPLLQEVRVIALGRPWMQLGLSALGYVAVLAATGELHPSSNALRFFCILWSVQMAGEVWQAWRRTRNTP
jgi:hypothetical protein